MTSPGPTSRHTNVGLDVPTDRDRRRQQVARARARRQVAAIDEAQQAALQSVFREELARVVRSASPLLIGFLAIEGLTLDDAVLQVEPQRGWPRRPRIKGVSVANHTIGHHLIRHIAAGLIPKSQGVLQRLEARQGYIVNRAEDDWLRLEVAEHSLEMSARIGPVRFETRFGELRIELDGALPGTLAIGCVGRLIEEVVDHAALRSRGWRIAAVEDAAPPWVGQVLVVVTDSVPYRLPWAC